MTESGVGWVGDRKKKSQLLWGIIQAEETWTLLSSEAQRGCEPPQMFRGQEGSRGGSVVACLCLQSRVRASESTLVPKRSQVTRKVPHEQNAKEAEDTEEQKLLPEDQTMTLVTTGQISLPSQKSMNASKYLSMPLPTKVGRERGGEDIEMMV